MKNKYLFLILSTLLFISCDKAVQYKDVILFTGTENSPVIRFTVEGPRSTGITITATDKVVKDTKVSIAIAKEMLASFNAKNYRSYELPPDNTYGLSATETVIKAGETVSETIQFSLKSFDGFEEGKTYCVPVRIVSTDGNFDVLEASRVMYVVINRTIISRAIDLSGEYAFNVPLFMTDPRVASVGAVTMEIRVRMNSFPRPTSNPGISSLMGIEENFLFRFGDISIDKNQLQLAPALIAGKKYFTTGSTRYQTNKWHQVVCVYDGSSVSIYVDGVLDVKFGAGPGAINFNVDYFNGFWFGQSCGGRRLDGAISEARFWTRALTMTEIQDNACYVNPNSEGLLAYWRFNAVQEDGKTVRDETGNGFDAVTSSRYINFVDNVKCPY